MPAVPSFYGSWRKWFTSLRHPKIGLVSIFFGLLIIFVWLPPAYQESWIDPFSTLNIPNRVLHPLAFTKIGLMDPSDPSHPQFFADKGKINELMDDLRHTVVASDLGEQPEQKILYFTLHRESSRYHPAADFALQYFPDKNIVYFGQQMFKIDSSTKVLLNDITQKMQPGWWK